jgi:hypothetical protein
MSEERLIDANALRAFIKANGYVYANTLDMFPTIDAIPVIRCKSCDLYEQGAFEGYAGGLCKHHRSHVGDNDYCSYGAKMDKEDESK